MPPRKLSSTADNDRQKKPRHRHSPAQLAALNELYDKDVHPALDLRTSLAARLGMETKTVNAWFQNKRASSKKRSTRDSIPYDVPHPSLPTSASSSSTNTPHHNPDLDDDDEEYSPMAQPNSSFHTGTTEHTHYFADADIMPRRMRMRPSPQQTDELRKLYNLNAHPTTEARQELADRIGMRYQSITNWFQNQRSLAKKRKEDEEAAAAATASATAGSQSTTESRTFAAFPPPSNHPSLFMSLPPPTSHPSLGMPALRSTVRMRQSPTPSFDSPPSRRMTPRRSVTPYGSTASSLSRPRRTRPEPYQLDALKDLFKKTATPSIDERSALALELGMDIGKVTNWFRNLRQTARKRAKKAGSGGDGDDDDIDFDDNYQNDDDNDNIYSRSISRSGTPSLRSSSSSSSGEDHPHPMDLDGDEDFGTRSDDEPYYHAMPSPDDSPSPSADPSRLVAWSTASAREASPPYAHQQSENATTAARFQKSGIKLEDAYLLLDFSNSALRKYLLKICS